MQGEERLVVVHLEGSLGGVHHPPHNGNADFHRIAQAVVDFLLVVAERHDFQGHFFAHVVPGPGGLHVSALVQLGESGWVDAGAEGVDPVEALSLQGADVVAEQSQHQCLLGPQHPKACQQETGHDGDEPAQTARQRVPVHQAKEADQSAKEHNHRNQEHEKPMLFIGQDFFRHRDSSFGNSWI